MIADFDSATRNEGDYQPAGSPGTKVTARLFVSPESSLSVTTSLASALVAAISSSAS
jgi:hypothetical protein